MFWRLRRTCSAHIFYKVPFEEVLGHSAVVQDPRFHQDWDLGVSLVIAHCCTVFRFTVFHCALIRFSLATFLALAFDPYSFQSILILASQELHPVTLLGSLQFQFYLSAISTWHCVIHLNPLAKSESAPKNLRFAISLHFIKIKAFK